MDNEEGDLILVSLAKSVYSLSFEQIPRLLPFTNSRNSWQQADLN
jgi:hypothetical protein